MQILEGINGIGMVHLSVDDVARHRFQKILLRLLTKMLTVKDNLKENN